ncbi:hypothetical protein CYV26_07720 [Carnobacterium maltaromaticum]|uniref:hypothetical protein n=1 Tax=Carnobacterium maltaromaticum TaxID=2751 RepID=UPI000C7954BA|nr:hypothetical protein [Carnobacterium maltaromaticum]PLS35259.1 hypothetical protein CYV30_10725 [Carnobacterium maltaromaticum]PLS35672.1 hypothetical protein CYV31_10705 [Carnobacterium maltaromaticum]PLS36122.1 hypothetical protein CYV33_07715 [Carnobacterium maltaromaticum]PLS42579.1 hypothetical protein CYV28_10660 [Carnobacterium maltaromaticum]PLS45600.1 hypothetical protein CYV27_07710 [Carnobacterium maltaromaticum]
MFKKSKIFCLVTTLLLGIIPFFIAGTNVYASETVNSVGSQGTTVNDTTLSLSTFEKVKFFVDSKISLENNQYVLNNPEEIKSIFIKYEDQISLETNSTFSGSQYFDYINKNVADMNDKLATGAYYTVPDNGIEKFEISLRNGKPEDPYRITSHWRGIKFQSFGHNGTIDIKTLFSNSVALQAAAAGVLACTPAAVFGIIPALGGGYDSLIVNSISALIDKEQDKKGIQVDTNNFVPTFSVYAN